MVAISTNSPPVGTNIFRFSTSHFASCSHFPCQHSFGHGFCSAVSLPFLFHNILYAFQIIVDHQIGRRELTMLLGDWLPHMDPLPHALCISHPASGSIMAAACWAALISRGRRRDHLYRMYRYLFTKDPGLLILPRTNRYQVTVWRLLYVVYVFSLCSSYFVAILIGLSFM